MLRNIVNSTLVLMAAISGVLTLFPQLEAQISSRPSYREVELAYPMGFTTSTRGMILPGRSAEVVNVRLEIDSKGVVDEVGAIWPTGLNDENPLDSFLRGLEFVPGQVQGKPSKQILLLQLFYNPSKSQIRMVFPIDTTGNIEDIDLFWASMRANGFSYPEIKSMPSYFFPIDHKYNQRMFPYLLARINFDDSGTVAQAEVIHSDAGAYTDQLISAADWADFDLPVESDGTPKSAYLTIALYNMATYPTNHLEFPLDSVSLNERYRVRLVPDTLGLMFKPVPRRYQDSGKYSLFGCRLKYYDTIGVEVSIDTAGQITQLRPYGSVSDQLTCYLKMASSFEFYPAIDFQGVAHPFEGLMRFEYIAPTIIRIRFCWIPGEPGCVVP